MIRSTLARLLRPGPGRLGRLKGGRRDEEDPQDPGDRKRKPEMSEMDSRTMREVHGQIRDTSEPFKVQSRERPLLTDRPTRLHLRQFELLKEHEVAEHPLLDRPKGVLDFPDRRLSQKEGRGCSPGVIQITGASRHGFTISEADVNGSLVLFPRQMFTWDIASPEDIRPHHFDLLEVVKPQPSTLPSAGYVLVGTGPHKHFLEDYILTRLKALGLKFDILDTVAPPHQFQAISTFNVCAMDGLNIVAFLIPGTLNDHSEGTNTEA